MRNQYRGKVKNGKLEIYKLDYFNKNLQDLEGSEVVVKIEKFKNQRSLNQNNYYWGVVIEILSTEVGYFADEMHELMCQKFLAKGRYSLFGEEYEIAGSTKNLKTDEFEDYLHKIRIWAGTQGIVIPLPNEILDTY